jgi:hypothetical protein
MSKKNKKEENAHREGKIKFMQQKNDCCCIERMQNDNEVVRRKW